MLGSGSSFPRFRACMAPPVLALTLLALGALPGFAATAEVQFLLPVRARLDLQGRSTLAVAPFIVVADEGEGGAVRRGVDVQKEFERYMRRLLRRHTRLKVIETGPIDYPTYDLEALARDQDFWRYIGERTQADLILTGSLDFDIQDRSGYRSSEYISPFDGRTYTWEDESLTFSRSP